MKFGAPHPKGTLPAFGISGSTDFPAEEDNAVAEIAAFFRRKDFAQLLLHLLWFFAVAQTQTAADANAVSVADNAAGNGIQIAQQ